MVADAKRWHDYCPGCKLQHRTAQDTTPVIGRGTGSSGRAAVAAAAIVCATCGESGHAMWDCPRGGLDEEAVTTPTTTDSSASEASVMSLPEHRLPIHASSAGRTDALTSTPLRLQQCPYLPSWERYSPPRTARTETEESRSPHSSSSTGPSSTSPTTSRLTVHQARRQRVREHFERSFGSLTDIANDPDYVSPIASLYGNAYARFQERERERRERQSMAFDEQHTQSELTPDRYRDYLLQTQRLRHETERIRSELESIRSPRTPPSTSPSSTSPPRLRRESNTQQVLEALRRQLAEDDRQLLGSSDSDEQLVPASTTTAREENPPAPSIFGRWHDMRIDPVLPLPAHSSRRRDLPPPRPKTPEALPKEDLTISNECKVCFSQHCDMLLLPCAHLALCEVSLPLPPLHTKITYKEVDFQWCAKKTYPEIAIRRVHNQCVICRGRVNKMVRARGQGTD